MNDLVAVEKLANWKKLKALVLDSVSSPITKRVYNMALNEFLAWFQQAPRPGFTKATVSAWQVSLEAHGLNTEAGISRPLGAWSVVGGFRSTLTILAGLHLLGAIAASMLATKPPSSP